MADNASEDPVSFDGIVHVPAAVTAPDCRRRRRIRSAFVVAIAFCISSMSSGVW